MPNERLRDALRSRFPDLGPAEAEKAASSREGVLSLLRERGMGAPESLLHFEEYMESGGAEVMPTMDPPSHAGPDGSSDNPGS